MTQNIAVVGLGKIGLPLAVQFANKGHQVVGVDINEDTVCSVNAGIEPFPGEARLQELLSKVVADGKLKATTEYAEAIPSVDAVVVVVPLFVDDDGQPDFGWMDSATNDIGRFLTPGTLVIYETTLPVGTTRKRWKPALEATSGLTEGENFHLAFSPERVFTGRVFEDLRKYPKLIGALSTQGASVTRRFYESVLDFDARPDLSRENGVWDLGSPEASELAKLAETTYRDVNIGLANQFAIFAEHVGIDVFKVIEASNSQPFSHIHQPGIAVGGHCIPVYPRLYLSNDPDATIVRSARNTNASMPYHAINLLEHAYGDLRGANVAVLGAAYRSGVKETAFSGVFATVRAIEEKGAVASVHDPLYSSAELSKLGFTPHTLGTPVDAAVIQTDHPEYRDLTRESLPDARVLVDGRAIAPPPWAGLKVVTLGRGS